MVVLWAFLLFLVDSVYLIPPYEMDTLKEFHAATSGGAWTEKWDFSTDPCSFPVWFGISCGYNRIFDSFVQGINLQNNNLQGTLTDLNLPNLISL